MHGELTRLRRGCTLRCTLRRRLGGAWGGLLALAAWAGAGCATAIAYGQAPLPSPSAAAAPSFWRSRMFFIPYQPAANHPLAENADRVQLMMSRDGGRRWELLEEAEPIVRGFSYHAPADGDYAFAVVLVDRRGDSWPKGDPQPQLQVVVDTQQPVLRLAAAIDDQGQLAITYDAADAHLNPQTLAIEVQNERGGWERLPLDPPALNRSDRVQGRVAWKPGVAAGRVLVRGAVDDRAGNRGVAAGDASLDPAVAPPAAAASTVALPGAGPQLGPAFDALAGPTLAPPTGLASSDPFSAAKIAAPPPENPYASTSGPASVAASPALPRTPARFAADTAGANGAAPTESADIAPPSLLTASPPPDWTVAALDSAPSSARRDEGWSTPSESAGAAASTRWVNALTFDIDYDLQSVGPWGVAKVELWATPDGGRTWTSFGVDADNRSPLRATAPGAGVYGFRILVDGANAAPSPPPRSGDAPELTVGVDLEPPRVELGACEVGEGPESDRLTIRWTAADERLDVRPVALAYAARGEGPWQTIAANVENTGAYSWRLERQMPERIFLRIEVRDVAGNVAVHTSPTPIVLNLPQPTGRLRNVRPAPADAQRFRTAERP